MHRKGFLSLLGSSILPLPFSSFSQSPEQQPRVIVPPYLKRGNTIGITCPAGYISLEAIQPSILQITEWGFKVKIGSTVGKRDFSFGGTDEERLRDLQDMLDDPGVSAVMCARGGYGAVRIVDRLRFEKFELHPKWLIGFSDITVLHSHIYSNQKVASIHSKMCNSFPDDWKMADQLQRETILSIRDALTGKPASFTVLPNTRNRFGKASGPLVGGNLKTLETLSGTKSDLDTKGAILFVEDTNEYLYSIDRMFRHLKRTGKLDHLSGIIIGGFKVKPDDPGEEFGRSLQDIVWDQVREYRYPLCFDFPVGHQRNNFALKCGVMHQLEVDAVGARLREGG